MSSGASHYRTSVALGLTGGPLVAVYHDLWPAYAYQVGAIVLGHFLSPDLDQETTNLAESRLLRHRNPLLRGLGHVYVWFWMPYATRVAHRSWVSHAPVVGTIIRLLYLIIGLGTMGLSVALLGHGRQQILIKRLQQSLALILLVGYIFGVLYVYQTVPLSLTIDETMAQTIIWAFLGWLVSDAAHWLQDQL